MEDHEPQSHRHDGESTKDQSEGIRSDPEIRNILEEADKDRPLQMEFPDLDDTEGLSEEGDTTGSVQNPKKAHRLYYGKKERILRQLLPGGNEYEGARSLIRDQVNLYLKEGHDTGRDGRQAHTHRIEEVVIELQECVEQNVPLFEIYSRLKEMNKEAGHLD
jgi:hypothetical protein